MLRKDVATLRSAKVMLLLERVMRRLDNRMLRLERLRVGLEKVTKRLYARIGAVNRW